MIPEPWEALVIALAVLRVVRLAGWDTWPPVERLRDWATGVRVVSAASQNSRMGLTSETVEERVVYRRRTLHELLSCAYCSGAWVSLAWYVAWRLEPSWALTAAFPLALSSVVGIFARFLDP